MAILYLSLGICSYIVALKTCSSPPSQLRQQVFSWWRIFPVISLSFLFQAYAPLLLMLLICSFVVRELVLYFRGPKQYFLLACLGGFGLIVSLSFQSPHASFSQIPLLIIVQFLLFLFRRNSNQLLLLLFFGSCYGISFLIQIGNLPFDEQTNMAWLFYLLTMTALNDVAQFVTGKLLGKQKIARRISPNKTWQGLAGGVVISSLLSVVLGSYLHLLTSNLQLLMLAVCLSLGGFSGDLLFSAAKRFLGIKDFSQLIPGHGGMLDRVDSLIITAPMLYFAIYFFHVGV